MKSNLKLAKHFLKCQKNKAQRKLRIFLKKVLTTERKDAKIKTVKGKGITRMYDFMRAILNEAEKEFDKEQDANHLFELEEEIFWLKTWLQDHWGE